MTKLDIRWAVLMAFLGASGVALAVDEVEPNNSASAAQVLTIDSTGTAQVNGVIGTLTGNSSNDADFFSFQGKAGDIVTIYTNGTTNLDTIIALFGPGTTTPPYINRVGDDDSAVAPPGSTNSTDSMISSFQLDADGIWTVGVGSGVTTNFASTGGVAGVAAISDPGAYGAYTLTITGVTPPAPPPPPVTQPPVEQPPVTPPPPPPAPVVQQINIDVLPGFGGLTRFDRKVKRSIPVVLQSSANFDAMQIDQSSLTFGATGDEKSLLRCDPHGIDINHDRRRDLMCHFDAQAAGFQPGDLNGIVRGKTLSGQEFEGKGFLKVINEKRHRRDRDHDGDRHRDRDDR
jgi:hypothetical protein